MKPGVSVTLGVSQGTHKPYGRITGRMFGLATSKKMDLSNPMNILLMAGVAAFSAKQAVSPATKKVKKEKPALSLPAPSSRSILDAFVNPV